LRQCTLTGSCVLELPSEHRIPLTWLIERGSEAIRYRTYRELAPAGYAPAPVITAAHQAALDAPVAQAIVRKQKVEVTPKSSPAELEVEQILVGTWAGNLFATGPIPALDIKDAGTIPQYRRLLQQGYTSSMRPMRLAERVLFRLLSRDTHPALLFEYEELVDTEPEAETWVRALIREGATAALAEAGHVEDPRIRGAAHKIANDVSSFLRSPLAEQPFAKESGVPVLHGDAHPPSWYSLSMIAAMPNLRRERAGFTERLAHYLAQPAPAKQFAAQVGRKTIRPTHLLLGDPIETDEKGSAKDIPVALAFIELLIRIGGKLEEAPNASAVLSRMFADCDAHGVWTPKNLRQTPKSSNPNVFHNWPLGPETESMESRQVDVTFQLARLAKLLGWNLSYT
jgi:hypothetical protein